MATGLAIGGNGGGGNIELVKYPGFGLLDKLWTWKGNKLLFGYFIMILTGNVQKLFAWNPHENNKFNLKSYDIVSEFKFSTCKDCTSDEGSWHTKVTKSPSESCVDPSYLLPGCWLDNESDAEI